MGAGHRAGRGGMILVGIVDGGIAGGVPADRIAAQHVFAEATGAAGPAPSLRHGREIGRIVHGLAPGAQLLDARIFVDRLAADAGRAAAALRWLAEQGARVVNLSFGLREGHPALRDACAEAVAAGTLLVAASPARGALVFPAAYPGVIRACGDARCGPDQFSAFGGDPADFGACPRPWNAPPEAKAGGASFAAAHLTGHIAAFLARCPEADGAGVRDHLDATAAFRGRERRYA